MEFRIWRSTLPSRRPGVANVKCTQLKLSVRSELRAPTRRSRCRSAKSDHARPVSPRPAGSRKRAAFDEAPGGGIFRIWSTEMPGPRAAGSAGIASSVAALLRRRARGRLTAKFDPRLRHGPFCRTRSIPKAPAQRACAAPKLWQHAPPLVRQFEVPSRYPALAIRSPDPKAARVLLVSRLPSSCARAICPVSRTSAKTFGQDLRQ